MAKLGSTGYENLINNLDAQMVKGTAKLDSTAVAMKRGAALQNDSGKIITLTASGTPYAILADDVAAGGGWASVYLTGHFNRDKVDEITGITVTDAQVEEFRKLGIFLSYARK